MSKVLQKALKLLTGSDAQLPSLPTLGKKRPLKKFTERELLQLESEIGGALFGPVPKGGRREFFNLDPTTWIWYEEATNDKGKPRATTTRYEIHDDRVLKVQEGPRYSYLDGDELQNFLTATQMYYEQVMRGVYKRDPRTGQHA